MAYELSEIRASYGEGPVLDGISLRLEPESVTVVLGPSGCGKTTLLNVIAGLKQPDEGIRTGFDDAQFSYAFQEPRLLPWLSSRDNIAFALSGALPREAALEQADRFLAAAGLADCASSAPGTLSGGMRQRLGIAQALVGRPELVIVDEPTAGLDPEERVRFRNLLSEHKGLKLVLLSTHIVSDVESVATEIAVVRQGRLLAFGTPEELVARAAGAVWEAELSAAEMERLRPSLTVANLTRNATGVKARLVARERPVASAVSAAASLEDAYLLLMREAGEALPSAA